DAVEKQAQRNHEREARAVEAEVGHNRLEKRPDRVADSRRRERHRRERGDDPPAVEDRSVPHDSGLASVVSCSASTLGWGVAPFRSSPPDTSSAGKASARSGTPGRRRLVKSIMPRSSDKLLCAPEVLSKVVADLQRAQITLRDGLCQT